MRWCPWDVLGMSVGGLNVRLCLHVLDKLLLNGLWLPLNCVSLRNSQTFLYGQYRGLPHAFVAPISKRDEYTFALLKLNWSLSLARDLIEAPPLISKT